MLSHIDVYFGRMSLSCSDVNNQDCQYIATWRTRGNRVEFNIAAQIQGWVGIGFSTNQLMVSYFHIYCYYQFKILCSHEVTSIIGAASGNTDFFVDDRFVA